MYTRMINTIIIFFFTFSKKKFHKTSLFKKVMEDLTSPHHHFLQLLKN